MTKPILALTAIWLAGCAAVQVPNAAPPEQVGAAPMPLQAGVGTSTPRPTPTMVPTETPVPVQYVTLGSPFASDFGDGIPRIWGNDAFDGIWYPNCNDDHHGHVDFFAPLNSHYDTYQGEVVAGISGEIKPYNDDHGDFLGIHLIFQKNTYPEGILEALAFAGVPKPAVDKIDWVFLDIGHLQPLAHTYVSFQEPFGDIVPAHQHVKIAYHIGIEYDGEEYYLSPTLFPHRLADGTLLRPMLHGSPENWTCVAGSPYDCVPTPADYAPTCKFGK